jgi:hypothetical protein
MAERGKEKGRREKGLMLKNGKWGMHGVQIRLLLGHIGAASFTSTFFSVTSMSLFPVFASLRVSPSG